MAIEYYVVFIDESGSGSKRKDKSNLWVSVGVIAHLKDHDKLYDDLQHLKKKSMRLYNKEMKGVDLSSNHMNPGASKYTVAEDLGNILKNNDLKVFVTACNNSSDLKILKKYRPSNEKIGLQPKDVARELLIENISYALKHDSKYNANTTMLIIWDLSDNDELADFSTSISDYKDSRDHERICNILIPHLLGGLSHEWAELQIADLISNYAINYLADGIFNDADKDKSIAFRQYIHPNLYFINNKSFKEKGLNTFLLFVD